MNYPLEMVTGLDVRTLVRNGGFAEPTAGQAPHYLQGNVVILPRRYASDFLQYCLNNPKPCPLIGLSRPGDPLLPSLGHDVDIRFDVPRYRIYRHGVLVDEPETVGGLWSDELVTFVLGCSFSFEAALIEGGFGVRHIEMGCNTPMFKSSIETVPAGIFQGPTVMSMRPYPADQVAAIFDLCANFPHAHGTPVYWGDAEKIGIFDLQNPDYGDPVEIKPGEIPVFWACGVTPQAAIEVARPDLCITHAPGHMLVTDIPSNQPIEVITGMVSFEQNLN